MNSYYRRTAKARSTKRTLAVGPENIKSAGAGVSSEPGTKGRTARCILVVMEPGGQYRV